MSYFSLSFFFTCKEQWEIPRRSFELSCYLPLFFFSCTERIQKRWYTMFVPAMGEFDVSFVLRISASPWHSLKFSSEGVCFRRLPNLCCVFLTNSEGTTKLVRVCMRFTILLDHTVLFPELQPWLSSWYFCWLSSILSDTRHLAWWERGSKSEWNPLLLYFPIFWFQIYCLKRFNMDNINDRNPGYGLKYYILENRKKSYSGNLSFTEYHHAFLSYGHIFFSHYESNYLFPTFSCLSFSYILNFFLSFECRSFVFLSFENQKQQKQLGGGTFLARQNDDDEGDLERIKIHLANIWYVSSTLTQFSWSFKNQCSSVWLLRKLENRKIVFVRNFHLRMFMGISWALKCW